MTERLADISARIDNVRQLDSVVIAMRGIAASRTQQSRNHLAGIEAYSDVITLAIGEALNFVERIPSSQADPPSVGRALIVFCAEQGFAGGLSDRMLEAARARVLLKQADMPAEELLKTANALAVGALRFFLLKFTRNTTIAFDFEDALKAEGETGPYCQYAVVRIRGIRRKGAEATTNRVTVTGDSLNALLNGPDGNGFWELLLLNGSLDSAVHAAINTQEPAFVTKYAFQLAQAFSNFYHNNPILKEADEQKQAFLLGMTELVERQLMGALDLLGIETPDRM